MVKIGKKNGKTYAIFEGNYDIFKLEHGLYLVVSNEKMKEILAEKLGAKTEDKKKSQRAGKSKEKRDGKHLNEREMGILIKISLVRFADREWEKVMKMLSKGDQIILKSLIKRGFVKVKKKDGKQYIIFSEDMYEKLKDETKKRTKEEKKEAPKKARIINIDNSFYIIPREHVQKTSKELDLKNYSYVSDSTGTVFMANKKKAKALFKKIMTALKKGKGHYQEIAEKAKIPEEVALILLKIMCEEGLVYEPEKNVFERVE